MDGLQMHFASLMQQINLLTDEVETLHTNSQPLYARLLSGNTQDGDYEEVRAISARMDDFRIRLREARKRMREAWVVIQILNTNGEQFTQEQESP
jgi:hypothetical protein